MVSSHQTRVERQVLPVYIQSLFGGASRTAAFRASSVRDLKRLKHFMRPMRRIDFECKTDAPDAQIAFGVNAAIVHALERHTRF